MTSISLSETTSLIQQSRDMVENSTDNPVLNLILQIVTNIQGSISQLSDNIEKRFEALNSTVLLVSGRVTKLETETDGLRKRFDQCETSVTGLSNLFDEEKSKTQKNTTNAIKQQGRIEVLEKYLNVEARSERPRPNDALAQIARRFTFLEKQIEELKKTAPTTVNSSADNDRFGELESAITDLQCRSMKNNLIFRNLFEHKDENTEEKIRVFIQRELGIDHHIAFGNVHRFGKRVPGKSRPIVARFIYHQDLRLVLDRASYLRNSKFSIHEQFPKSIEDKRRTLYPILKQAKIDRQNAVLIRDKLFINGRRHIPDDVEVEPTATPPSNGSPQNQSQTENTGYRDRLLNRTPRDDDSRRYKRARGPSDSTTPEREHPRPPHVNNFY